MFCKIISWILKVCVNNLQCVSPVVLSDSALRYLLWWVRIVLILNKGSSTSALQLTTTLTRFLELKSYKHYLIKTRYNKHGFSKENKIMISQIMIFKINWLFSICAWKTKSAIRFQKAKLVDISFYIVDK